MKKILRSLKIIAFTALVGFLMTCGEGEGPVVQSSAPLGANLALSGQVYRFDGYLDDFDFSFYKFMGDSTLSTTYGGTGGIDNGIFTFELGTPGPLVPIEDEFEEDPEGGFTNVIITPSDVKGFVIPEWEIGYWDYLTRGDMKGRSTENFKNNIYKSTGSATQEMVMYIYVDDDVTLTATGSRGTEEDSMYIFGVNVEMNITYIMKDLNILLNKGWNVVYVVGKVTMATNINLNKHEGTINMTISAAMSARNPNSLKWLLDFEDYSSYSGSSSMLPESLLPQNIMSKNMQKIMRLNR